MATDWNKYIDEIAPTSQQDTGVDWGKYVDETKSQPLDLESNLSLQANMGRSPESVAKELELSKRFQLPTGAIRVNDGVKRFESMAKLDDIQETIKHTEALKSFLANDDFAGMAHQDVHNLAGIEQANNEYHPILKGFTGAAQSIAKLSNDIAHLVGLNDEAGNQAVAALGSAYKAMGSDPELEKAMQVAKERGNLKDTTGIWDGMTEGVRAIPYMASAIYDSEHPLSVLWNFAQEQIASVAEFAGGYGIAKKALAGAVEKGLLSEGLSTAASGAVGNSSAVFLSSLGNNYQQALDQGLSPDEATHKAYIKTLAEVPANAVAGAFIGHKFFGGGLGNVAGQIGVQGAGGGAGNVMSNEAVGETSDPTNTALEIAGEGITAPVDVAAVAAEKALSGKQDAQPEAQPEAQPLPDDILKVVIHPMQEVQQKSLQADTDAATLKNMMDLSRNSQLNQLSKEDFAQFVDAASDGKDTQTVYVDGQFLAQSGIGESLAKVSPAIASQLPIAENSGYVGIPLSEFLAHVAPTKEADALLDHAKFDVNGWTQSEKNQAVEQHAADMISEANKMIEQKGYESGFAESAKEVYDHVLGQLDAIDTPYDKSANQAMAKLHEAYATVRASQLGITPMDFYKRNLLKVTDGDVDGSIQAFVDLEANQTTKESIKKYVQAINAFFNVENSNDFPTAEEQYRALAGEVEARNTQKRLGMNAQERKLTAPSATQDVTNDKQILRYGKSKNNSLGQSSKPYTAPTITVDGIERPTTNSNGQPIAQTEQGLINFWRWFGDSKVVDSEGKPLVVYHGTAIDFDSFNGFANWFSVDKSFADGYAMMRGGYRGGGEVNYPAYLSVKNAFNGDALSKTETIGGLFTAMLEQANNNGTTFDHDNARSLLEKIRASAKREESGKNYRNYDFWFENSSYFGEDGSKALKEAFKLFGFDGISFTEDGNKTIAAFNPNQIKSAIGNNGNFDPADNNILHQLAPENDLIVMHNLTEDNLLHAIKLGGLPVPSLAVTRKESPITSFGDITLIGNRDLIDPKGYAKTQVYGADIYSPRYPQITYSLSSKSIKQGDAIFKSGEKETGNTIDWREVERRGARELARSAAVMFQFLTDRGISPDIKHYSADVLPEWLMVFKDDKRDAEDIANDPAFIESAKENLSEQNHNSQFFKILLRGQARKVEQYRSSLSNAGKVDARETQYALDKQIADNGLRDELDSYAKGILSALNPAEKIYVGHDERGARYIPHNLANVIKILKKDMRGGEGYSYGTGSIRAKVTPQFKTIKDIKGNKDRLVDKQTFDKAVSEIESEFTRIAKLISANLPDATMESIIEDSLKMNPIKAAKEYGHVIDDGVAKEISDFITKLRNMPTEYFEAKITRAVDLSEFKGAVVPVDIGEEALSELRKHGLDVQFYTRHDDADRAKAINSFEHLFFQNSDSPLGTFNPRNNVISLLKDANLSTFLHESAHYFFTVDMALAADLVNKPNLTEGEKQIVSDADVMLDWFGFHGTEAEKLALWHSLSLDEQRNYHEQVAESFERYLFSGEAPSVELQPVFQRFRSWMIRVYKSIKDFLAGHPDAGKLNDDVKAVFDRMLATNEQIATAEQARALMPLLTSPKNLLNEKEFEEYQALGMFGTADAIDQMQAENLKTLQWLDNKRIKAIRELTKEASAQRKEVEFEVKQRVMAQPIYRAWAFLTQKMTDQERAESAAKEAGIKAKKNVSAEIDPTTDDLFTAIAKLGGMNRMELETEWGVDIQKSPQPIFGKPVWLKSKGLSVGAMAELLNQYGYLDGNNLRDFEEKFNEMLRGRAVYSNQVDFNKIYPDADIKFTDDMTAGKLSSADLATSSLTNEQKARLESLKMVRKHGINADSMADYFGFVSGEAMMLELAEAPTPAEKIKFETDALMIERYSDLATPEAIKEAADKAVHNDMMIRMATTEANALNRAIGQRQILREAVKLMSERIINGTLIKDIRPYQYASAGAKAARSAAKAYAKGDFAQAATDKRNQVLSMELTKASYDAQAYVAKSIKYFKRLQKKAAQGNMRGEYLEQLNTLLAKFNLTQKPLQPAVKSLMTFINERVDAIDGVSMPDIADWVYEQYGEVSYKLLTIEKFKDLVDAVKGLEHLAKREHTQYKEGKYASFTDEKNAMMEQAQKSMPDLFDKDGELKKVNPIDEMNGKFDGGFIAGSYLSPDSVAEIFDGGKFGAFFDSIVKRMSDASNEKSVIMQDVVERLKPLFDAYSMSEKRDFANKSKTISTVVGIGSFTREQAVSMALMYGNPEGRQRLQSLGITDDVAQRIFSALTEKDTNLINGIWSMFDDYLWGKVEAVNKATTGIAPPKVQAAPFTVNNKPMRGGYYPIRYLSAANTDNQKHDDTAALYDLKAGIGIAKDTRRSASKERLAQVNKFPRLDLGVFSEVLNETVHDVAFREALADTMRVVNDKDIRALMIQAMGKKGYAGLRKNISETGVPQSESKDLLDKLMTAARKNTVAALLSGVTTALQNYTGLIPALVHVNALGLSVNVAKFHSPLMFSMMNSVFEKSVMMRNRAKSYDHDLNSMATGLQMKNQYTIGLDKALFLMSAIDRAVSIPVWVTAYEKSIKDGLPESEAITQADYIVTKTQGTGREFDQASLTRGSINDWKKIFLMFFSYFQRQGQRLVVAGAIAKQEYKTNPAGAVANFTGKFILISVLPAAITSLLFGKGGDDEDMDKKLERMALDVATYPVAMIPLARDLVRPALQSAGIDANSFGYKMSPVESMLSTTINAVGSVGDVIDGEADNKDAKNLIFAAGFLTGAPAKLINDVAQGSDAVINDGADWWHVFTGRPKQ